MLSIGTSGTRLEVNWFCVIEKVLVVLFSFCTRLILFVFLLAILCVSVVLLSTNYLLILIEKFSSFSSCRMRLELEEALEEDERCSKKVCWIFKHQQQWKRVTVVYQIFPLPNWFVNNVWRKWINQVNFSLRWVRQWKEVICHGIQCTMLEKIIVLIEFSLYTIFFNSFALIE